MMRWRVVREIASMTFRDFVRTPEAVFWSYGFPLIMALALGFAFSRGEVPEVQVAVVDVGWQQAGWSQLDPDAPDAWAAAGGEDAAVFGEGFGRPAELLVGVLRANVGRPRVTFEIVTAEVAEQRLVRGEVDVIARPHVVGSARLAGADPAEGMRLLASGEVALDAALRFDPTRPESDLARSLVELALERHLRATVAGRSLVARELDEVTEPGSRYIDFLIPGLIGLNLLGSGLFGVGFNLVQMRVHKMLRRLAVTPMRRREFLAAFLLGRMVLMIPEVTVVILLGVFVFGVPLQLVDVPLLALVIAVGSLLFSGLGLLVASRARTIEAVSGLMNLAMVPMWLLGGCFFSVERFPDVFWPLIACVPMYWFTEAARDVMLSGAGFDEIAVAFAVLVGWAVGTFVLASRLFRWQ